MDARLISLGALLLFVSSMVSMEVGTFGSRTPFLYAAVASLGTAVGSMLLGAVRGLTG